MGATVMQRDAPERQASMTLRIARRCYNAHVRAPLAAFVGLALLACERQAPPKEPPLTPKRARSVLEARLEEELRQLSLEAGVDPPDPPAPSGSLRDEIDRFDSLDACTTRLTSLDPLLGDALDALGYDGLARDACRLLEALATRDPKRCAPILATPLRARCETDLATLVGDPSLCPLMGPGRDPLCLARAHRDRRYCSALPNAEKAHCEALVSGDASFCQQDARCQRQVARWAPLLEPPAQRPAFATELVVNVERADGSQRTFDLSLLSERGVVVRKTRGRHEISLGTKPTSAVVHVAEPSQPAGAFLLSLPVAAKSGEAIPLDPLHGRFDLLLPGLGLLTSAGAQAKGTFQVTQFSTEPGTEIAFELDAKVVEAGEILRVRAEVRSFVRDVVAGN